MSFWSALASVTKSSQDGWLSRVLTGAGITLASYSIHKFYLEQYISDFISSLGGISGFGASLIHMSGIDIYIQSVLTALVIAMAQNSQQLFLKKGGK
ncbi:DUF2523 family protein [Acinetobacter guillouiae]|uniref:DUF2523 family protein n=1 Tax=Acinetobacter TaxID=469 RepID=UPI0019025C79|nr:MULTISPECIES: DUF2523 domain-containing protein [Acinetobacter]MBJ8424376.1 DUF2523 domain-containing protein [Acinetobacter bereziniae]UOH16491.1 DUF2523 domain-containing protein [Acinetobacter sp. NyZ410]